jgi:peptidyl-prolyl cis-trans isomerase SurA
MIKKIIIALVICVILPLNAQNKKDKVLLTIENKPVYVSEFLRVYNKNKEVVSQENKKDINEYLDLFINYKLKLRQAYDLKLDTVPSYIKEFTKYKEQLIEPFLKDRNVTDNLVREAYDRMKQEVKASHILVKLDAHALPKDTLKAYNKLIEAREKILKGADFEVVAKEYSEDPSAKKNGGDLGYFTAFSMVYRFENAAYTTNIGDISMPFKTNFGYHIVKVNDKRASKGEVKVAHIMV